MGKKTLSNIFSKLKGKFSKKKEEDIPPEEEELDEFEEFEDEEELEFEEEGEEESEDILETDEKTVQLEFEGEDEKEESLDLSEREPPPPIPEEEEDFEEDDVDFEELQTMEKSIDEEEVAQEEVEAEEEVLEGPQFDELADDEYEDEEEEEDFESQIEIDNVPEHEIQPSFLQNIKEKFSFGKMPSFGGGGNGEPPKKGGRSFSDFLPDFNSDQMFNEFFSPGIRPTFHKIFFMAMVAGATYSVGKLVAVKLASLSPPSRSIKAGTARILSRTNYAADMQAVKNKNLFNAKDSLAPKKVVKKKKVETPKKCFTANTKSSLPLKLINSIVLQDSIKSMASIQVRSAKEATSFREGDIIKGLAKIGKINRLRVVLKNSRTGRCEYIQNIDKKAADSFKRKKYKVVSKEKGKKLLEKKISGITNVGNKFKIKNELRAKMLSNIGNVLTQARAIQIKNPDGSLAFKITDIVPGSIYSHLNIKDGDIITKIDGKRITSLNEIMGLFGKIKEVDNLSLTVKRNGEEEKQEYNFED